MLLLASSRRNLTAALRADGVERVEHQIDFYRDALASGGTPSLLVYVDDLASMAAFGLDPVASLDSNSIGGAIRSAVAAIAAGGSDVAAIALIGGDAIIPFWRVLNPVTIRTIDPDPVVLTDNPYGASDDRFESWLTPELPVGRFCSPDGSGPEALEELFKDAANNHWDGRNMATDNRIEPRQPFRQGSCAVVNDEWIDPSIKAGQSLTRPVTWRRAPEFRVVLENRCDLNAKYLYFNLHGFSGEAGWKGYDPKRDEFITALSPESFSREHVRGSLLFAENCYGAEVAGRTPDNSCALRALAMGAGAFIGSTGLAFGSFIAPETFLANADELAGFFFQHATSGTPAGPALTRARADYMLSARRNQLDPFEQKTALQFVLLGDPAFV